MADPLNRPALSAADEDFASLVGSILGVINMPAVAHRGFRSAVDWMQAALDLPPAPSAPRIYTGYMPEQQRRALRHFSHCNGLPVLS